jgi:DNA-binding transcriptional ArsR family regulator
MDIDSEILNQLSQIPTPIKELANNLSISYPTVMIHLLKLQLKEKVIEKKVCGIKMYVLPEIEVNT